MYLFDYCHLGAIDEVIRGIFDARQSLGRQYSAFYYYALYVSRTKVWIERIDKLGVYEAATRITQTFIELDDRQKMIFVTHSYDHHTEKYYGVKPKCKKDMLQFEDKFNTGVQFPGEPVAPPISGKELYMTEIKKQRRSGSHQRHPDWKNLTEEAQQVYMKKLYYYTKSYVADFEQFVARMTPNDLLHYAAVKSRLWEKNLHTNLHRQRALKEFTFPLPNHDLSEDDDDEQPEIIRSEDERLKLRDKINSFTRGKKGVYKSVLDTNAFLETIVECIDDKSKDSNDSESDFE